MTSITHWNVSEALLSPNSIQIEWNSLWCNVNAFYFHLRGFLFSSILVSHLTLKILVLLQEIQYSYLWGEDKGPWRWRCVIFHNVPKKVEFHPIWGRIWSGLLALLGRARSHANSVFCHFRLVRTGVAAVQWNRVLNVYIERSATRDRFSLLLRYSGLVFFLISFRFLMACRIILDLVVLVLKLDFFFLIGL